MKEHGENKSLTTTSGLSVSLASHISSSKKLIPDQELQHLVTSSIAPPPYGGLSLTNASVALDFGTEPVYIYSTHLFASLAGNNSNARFQLPMPIPLALQPAPANHSAHQNPLNYHQRSIFHHLPATVLAFRGLPGATLPHAAQLDIPSSWVNKQPSKGSDDRNITSTTNATTNSTTIITTNKKNEGNKNNKRSNSQVNKENNKNLSSGNVIKLSKRSANGSADPLVAKANRKKKGGHNHMNFEWIVSSSENDVLIKKEEFEKDAESTNFIDSITKPFIVDNFPQSPTLTSNNNTSKSQGRTSPGQNRARDKVFPCSTCNRCFGYKHVLINHERTHTGEKPFECNICLKRFARDHHVKVHMRLHTGEKPYQCNLCGRQFVQVANLRRHLRVHTGERPYACQLCSSKFSDSNQLKAHMLIHTGEKPYSCTECGGQFRRPHHLTRHKCFGEDSQTSKGLIHHSPLQLLTPSSAAGSDKGSVVRSGGESGASAKCERKNRENENRRIFRRLPVAATVTQSPHPLTFLPGSGSPVPEQDYPEDLSMNGSLQRSRNYSGSSSSVTAMSRSSSLLRPYCNFQFFR